MKHLVVTLLTLTFFGAGLVEAAHLKNVTLGFIPGENPIQLRRNGVQLAKILQSKLGVPMDIYISKDYDGLVQAMKKGKVDFAFLTANTFVEAERVAGAKVLLKKVWKGPYYHSAIVTLKSSGIKNFKGLKGKRFGFVDKKSTSGFLYPSVHFNKKGINPQTYFSEVKYFGNHENSVKALLAGKVDAIAVFSDDDQGVHGAWNLYAPQKRGKFKTLWISSPIPNDPFVVRSDFYDKNPRYTHDLMFSLIDFRDNPKDKSLLSKLLGIETLDLATSKQYDPVRELQAYLKKHQTN